MRRPSILRDRTFRAVFIGQVLSSLGSALVPVALTFAVLRQTGSASDLGLVLGADAAASLAFYLIGGVAADRLSRRVVMIAADWVRAVGEIATGLLLIGGTPSVSLLCAFVALQGAAGGFFTPAATGLVAAVVSRDRLQQANTLQAVANGIATVFGPACAGLLLITVGGGWALIADGVTFGLNAIILMALRVSVPQRQRAQATILANLRQGWGAFTANRWYVNIVLSASVGNFSVGLFLTVGPVVARRYLGGASAWAAVWTAGAAGAALASMCLMRVHPRHPLRTGGLVAVMWPLVPVAVALHFPLAVICVIAAIGFGGAVASDALAFTAVQQSVPEEVLSRVVSYDYFFASLSVPLGLIAGGPLAATFGATVVLCVGSVVSLGVLVIATLHPTVWTFASVGAHDVAATVRVE
jgi:MFS family permease